MTTSTNSGRHEPGTVAVVTWTDRTEQTFTQRALRTREPDGGRHWWTENGAYLNEEWVTGVRPLVVLDLDAATVKTLPEALARMKQWSSLTVEHNAIDALLSHIPEPKPDEPKGLGAVVVDGDDEKWVRLTHGPNEQSVWRREAIDEWRQYDDIDVVEIHTDGVRS